MSRQRGLLMATFVNSGPADDPHSASENVASAMSVVSPLLRIGCPVWACEHWKGSLYKANAVRRDWLGQYSSVFSTVEVNSTFYAIPALDLVQRWAESVSPDFRFCLKVPRSITHDHRLHRVDSELNAFLQITNVLQAAGVLGPSFIQLPPDFSRQEASVLERFLTLLPADQPWALEVRHHDWFDRADQETWLIEQLRRRNIDYVIFDSRPLYSKPPADEIEKVSQTRKPRTPLRRTVTGRHPFLRFIGRNTLEEVQPWIVEWAPVVAGWMQDGLQPLIFTHAPDDRFAPDFARRMHRAIQPHCRELPDLPAWPGESGPAMTRQKSLFD